MRALSAILIAVAGSELRLYGGPERRRDAVSAAPDVAALDTPAVAHSAFVGHPLAGRLPACEAAPEPHLPWAPAAPVGRSTNTCLLYTSDAADDRSSGALGGRRITE